MATEQQREEMTEEQAWAALEVQGRLQRLATQQHQTPTTGTDPLKILSGNGRNLGSERRQGWPTRALSEEDWEAKFAALKAEREAFIAPLALDMGKPRECQGADCKGYIYQWYGPLNLNAPGVGFVERPCPCERGKHWAKAELEKANNVEVKHHRYELLKGSGIPLEGIFKDCTLTSYASTPNGAQKWYKAFVSWTNEEWLGKAGATSQGAVLMGGFGVGKTGLAIGFGKEVIDKLGVKVFFINLTDFVEQIGRSWEEKDGSGFALLDRMKRRQLLILNDLGAGHGSAKDWDDKSPMQYLFNILDSRYNAGLPVLITSNCQGPLALQAIVGERNMNRIFDSCKIFNCTGQNLRKGAA
jgi:DNA replication protein DnaC